MRPTLHDLASWLFIWGSKIGAVRYRPDSAGSAQVTFYDQHFAQRHLELFEVDIRSRLRREQVEDALASVPKRGVLADLGCGVGHMIRSIRPDCRRVGIDLSRHSLQLASQRRDGVLYAQASAYQLPFPDNSLDGAVCLEMIEHIADDERAIEELARALKPGAVLVASVPNSHYFASYLALMGHYRHYTTESMASLFARHGLAWIRGLNDYRALNRRYLYVYAPLRILSVMLSALKGRYQSVYTLRIPGLGAPLYARLLPLMQRWISADEGSPSDATTFAVFRRV